jgi:hypothetical protein
MRFRTIAATLAAPAALAAILEPVARCVPVTR